MSERQFGGKIGVTTSDSVPWWPSPELPHTTNVLLVVFDDTGWSDFGCFGSEISTPAINELARNGLRYTNFHVTPLCSPTRASLMTGRNHHAVGMRFLADTDTGFPNSRGRVDPSVPMIPQLLRERGYGTYLAGKWHLTPAHEITPAGPFGNWPLGRGFDRFYGFLGGCVDQYSPELCCDNHQLTPPRRDDYHLSEDLVENAVAFLCEHVTYRAGAPFFLELAFGATHAPFQAPRNYIEKYIDVFSKGWDKTREDRLARQIDSGLVPPNTLLTAANPGVPPWDSLSADEQRLYVNLQAAFAGFLEHADAQLGRLMAALTRLGLVDDTLVIVLSDNGASREGGRHGAVDVNAAYSGVEQSISDQLKQLTRIGLNDGPAHYPEGWAMAGNTPFRRYKQYVDLGGVRSPLIISWPKGIPARGEIRTQFAHVVDIAPTIATLLGVKVDCEFDGISIDATIADPESRSPRAAQYWEMLGHRAIWHDGWKAVTEHSAGTKFEDDNWRLYNTTMDFSEVHDLATVSPERLVDLQSLWWREATRFGVLPLDDRSLVELLQLKTPVAHSSRSRIVLRPNQAHVPATMLLGGSDRSFVITAQLRNRSNDDDGVLFSSGGASSGYVFYVLDGHLAFEHVALGMRTVCISEQEIPLGDNVLTCSIAHHSDRSAAVRLFVNGQLVGTTVILQTLLHLSFWGIDVGRDRASSVSQAYQGEFPFSPTVLEYVTLSFSEAHNVTDLADEVEGVE